LYRKECKKGDFHQKYAHIMITIWAEGNRAIFEYLGIEKGNGSTSREALKLVPIGFKAVFQA